MGYCQTTRNQTGIHSALDVARTLQSWDGDVSGTSRMTLLGSEGLLQDSHIIYIPTVK